MAIAAAQLLSLRLATRPVRIRHKREWTNLAPPGSVRAISVTVDPEANSCDCGHLRADEGGNTPVWISFARQHHRHDLGMNRSHAKLCHQTLGQLSNT